MVIRGAAVGGPDRGAAPGPEAESPPEGLLSTLSAESGFFLLRWHAFCMILLGAARDTAVRVFSLGVCAMERMESLVCWALFALVAAGGFAGEAGDEELRREFMQLMQKRKAGQELTQDEMNRLRQIREQMPAGRKGREGAPGREGRVGRKGEMEDRRFARGAEGQVPRRGGAQAAMSRFNVLDQAAFAVADALVKGDKATGAVKELTYVADKSPDAEAKSLANLKIGDIYREKLDDATKAATYYYKVGGDLSERARGIVVGPLVKNEKLDEAISELERFIKHAPDAVAKSGAVRMLVEIAVKTGDLDKMTEALGKARELLSYGEATKAAKILAEKRKEAGAAMAAARGREGAPAPWAGGMKGMRQGGPEAAENLKMMIRKLKEAGRPEIAEKLEKRLEMMERGGPGGDRPGLKGRDEGPPAAGEIF